MFAGIGVADRRGEEAEAEGQHDNVPHLDLLCDVIRGADQDSALMVVEVPPAA